MINSPVDQSKKRKRFSNSQFLELEYRKKHQIFYKMKALNGLLNTRIDFCLHLKFKNSYKNSIAVRTNWF